jgi:hypothetical protein
MFKCRFLTMPGQEPRTDSTRATQKGGPPGFEEAEVFAIYDVMQFA